MKFRTILLTVILLLSGCSKFELPDPSGESALRIENVSGNYQKGEPYKYLKDSIVFRVSDKQNNPVPYQNVNFSIVCGSGMVDNNLKETDVDGLVYVRWKTGGGPDQIVKAAVADDAGVSADSYVIANSDVEFSSAWTSGIMFYKNFTEPEWHDNRILETNHFLIFSNAATDDSKVAFGKIAEEHLYGLLTWFELSYGELGLDPENTESKIRIYAHTSTTQPGTWSGVKNYGILFQAYGSKGWIRSGLKHELTHIVELLIIGPENCIGSLPPAWFAEGIAEYFGDYTCTCPSPIDNLTKLDSWESSHKNPVSINDYSDMGSVRACEYYTMFGLVMKYLLDPDGKNINCDQIKGMYHDLAVSKDFGLSFEQNTNISVTELEQNIYSWLTGYLSAR